jgi:hypothetical protein
MTPTIKENLLHNNWLERLIGSISYDAAFMEALEYGRDFRQFDKPITGTGK